MEISVYKPTIGMLLKNFNSKSVFCLILRKGMMKYLGELWNPFSNTSRLSTTSWKEIPDPWSTISSNCPKLVLTINITSCIVDAFEAHFAILYSFVCFMTPVYRLNLKPMIHRCSNLHIFCKNIHLFCFHYTILIYRGTALIWITSTQFKTNCMCIKTA